MEVKKQFNVVGLQAEFPKSLFRNVYAYADSADLHSLRILRRRKIRSFRPRKAYRLRISPRYCLVCCELGKRDEQAFLEALDELERDLLVMGYRDYAQYCDEAFALLHGKA